MKNNSIEKIEPEWHHIDAKSKVLGRLATEVAGLVMGKHRSDWAPNKVAPVFVVITNTNEVVLTGKKEEQKMYRRHTGYPSGIRERTAGEVRKRDSRKLISSAVSGMLPKNNLRDDRLQHLKLYPEGDHPHIAQISKDN